MLPQLSGIEILKQLRHEGNRVPIIMLTAKDTTQDRVEGLDSGADDYLIKPFTLAELAARVRAMIRRRYQVNSSTLRFDDMTIDLAAKSAMRAGQQIELTAKEFALLELLALRAGQVVSRIDIWNHIYDENDDSTSNVVDVYIGYLRRKLEAHGGQRLIHTRRGFGYVLECQT